MPKVSVLMSVYNGERFLREAVESILDQTFKDFEFIVKANRNLKYLSSKWFERGYFPLT